MMNTICCVISMMAVMTFGIRMGKYLMTACIFMSQINMAYNDTVTDALTVETCNKRRNNGGANLNSIQFVSQAIGAIVGGSLSVLENHFMN